MRILFAGSPAIAVPSLKMISNMDSIELVGVLTNPDTPKGRSGTLVPTETGEAAERQGLPVFKPAKLDAQVREEITSLKPDILVSFAYGKLFGPKFLKLFPLGGINIHPSLLPKYRGPTPIQAAILNRDTETGISIQKLAKELDSGDILAVEKIPLDGTETTASLSEAVSEKAALILRQTLVKIAKGEAAGVAQDHNKASYCKLITKEDGLIDWDCGAQEIEAKIRAYTPWPLCRTIHNNKELFILKAQVSAEQEPGGISGQVLGINNQYGIMIRTGKGILGVTELQYSGKKALFWKDFLNGARGFINQRLGVQTI